MENQRYNKGSNSLPLEERGPANHRLFARCVAKLEDVTAFCYSDSVSLRDFTEDDDYTVYKAAVEYNMIQVECESEWDFYVHVDILSEQ